VWAVVDDDVTTRETGFHGGKTDKERARVSGACLADMDAGFATMKPDINPSDTLQYRSARADDDEKHICPLQLEVIRRAIRLWTNPDDVILSPFAGIASEGYVALQEGRRFIGAELKDSYFAQATANLQSIAEVVAS
jgi:DNA modification methylase